MWPPLIKDLVPVSLKELNVWKHFKPVVFIFFPALAVTVYSVLDKTMIGFLAKNPDYANGCYEQAYKINSIALLIVTIISPIYASRNSFEFAENHIKELERNIYSACNYVWAIAVPLMVGFWSLSGNLSFWFLGEGYIEVPLLLIIMSIRFLLSGFSEIFGNQLFVPIGKEKYPTIATLCAAVINFILNIFLIPLWGATGAAITTALAELTVVVVLIVYLKKEKFLDLKKIVNMSKKYILAAVIMFVCLEVLKRKFNYTIWSFMLLVFSGVVIYASVLIIVKEQFLLGLIRRELEKYKKDGNQ